MNGGKGIVVDHSVTRWKRKVDALIRLAKDQAGKPEGEVARRKIKQILEKYPEAKDYQPFREFMLRDLTYMKRVGISTDGSWTGGNLFEAIQIMCADYWQRIEKHKAEQQQLPGDGK